MRKNYRYAMWKLLSKEKLWICKAHHYWPSLSHCIEYTSPWAGLKLTTLMVICTDCIGSCKSNYHTKMTTTTLFCLVCGILPKNIPVHENKAIQKKKYFKNLWKIFFLSLNIWCKSTLTELSTFLLDLQQQYTKWHVNSWKIAKSFISM